MNGQETLRSSHESPSMRTSVGDMLLLLFPYLTSMKTYRVVLKHDACSEEYNLLRCFEVRSGTTRLLASNCEHSNQRSGCIKGEEYLNQLRNWTQDRQRDLY
jgi:hypothetical protein